MPTNNYGILSDIDNFTIKRGDVLYSYGLDVSTPKVSLEEIEKVVYNGPATIVFWKDGDKTIVKTMDGDEFNPEMGFLKAYFEKVSGLSKTQSNKILAEYRQQYEEQNK